MSLDVLMASSTKMPRFRMMGNMPRLKVALSPQKINTVFQVAKDLIKGMMNNENVGLLAPIKKANQQFRMEDLLPENETYLVCVYKLIFQNDY